MKTLIEKSIEIGGLGPGNLKTVFTAESQFDKLPYKYKSLVHISGRKLSIDFKYEEDGSKKDGRLQLTIIKSDSEQTIKDFILESINTHLNSN